MFNIVELPKTPRIARRLVEMANIGGLDLDPEIYKLAEEELLGCPDFSNFPLTLSEKELKTVQFIKDRKGRSVILESQRMSAKQPVLAHCWLEQKFPILIVANNLIQDRWVTIIQNIWPNATINVYGRHKAYKDKIKLTAEKTDQLTFTALPEDGFDFYITKPSEIYLGDLLKRTRLAQVIINHVADIGSVTNSTLRDIEHVCLETAASIMLVNVQQCVTLPKRKNQDGCEGIDWNEHNLAIKSMNILYPSMPHEEYLNNNYDRADRHLTENQITLDKSKWLPMLNICTDLVKDMNHE